MRQVTFLGKKRASENCQAQLELVLQTPCFSFISVVVESSISLSLKDGRAPLKSMGGCLCLPPAVGTGVLGFLDNSSAKDSARLKATWSEISHHVTLEQVVAF